MTLRVGILISGRGSNMAALIDACAATDFPAEVVLVIANKADAAGLAYAAAKGIATRIVAHGEHGDAFEAALDAPLRAAGVELVCLAGFMRLLSEQFVNNWRDRIINIHPSLLPSFKGLNTHRKAVDAGVRISGCTVHVVRPEMDDGPILIQEAVAVHQDDTPDSLADRILEAEHRCYPAALRLIAEKRVRIKGNRVVLDGAPPPAGTLRNPE